MDDQKSVNSSKEHSGGVATESPRPALDTDAWMPIRTAPRNGTRIRGGKTYADDMGQLKREERITWWGKTSHVPLYGWAHGDDVEDIDLWEPAYWKPLNEPERDAENVQDGVKE